MSICASKTQFFPESELGKHFQGSGMRTIDSPYKITPIGSFKKVFRLPDGADKGKY